MDVSMLSWVNVQCMVHRLIDLINDMFQNTDNHETFFLMYFPLLVILVLSFISIFYYRKWSSKVIVKTNQNALTEDIAENNDGEICVNLKHIQKCMHSLQDEVVDLVKHYHDHGEVWVKLTPYVNRLIAEIQRVDRVIKKREKRFLADAFEKKQR